MKRPSLSPPQLGDGPGASAREILEAAGRLRPLSATLRRKMLPGVTLDEVRALLSQTAGPSLSDLIQAQRGEKQ